MKQVKIDTTGGKKMKEGLKSLKLTQKMERERLIKSKESKRR